VTDQRCSYELHASYNSRAGEGCYICKKKYGLMINRWKWKKILEESAPVPIVLVARWGERSRLRMWRELGTWSRKWPRMTPDILYPAPGRNRMSTKRKARDLPLSKVKCSVFLRPLKNFKKDPPEVPLFCSRSYRSFSNEASTLATLKSEKLLCIKICAYLYAICSKTVRE
jgi:hypothetical protein